MPQFFDLTMTFTYKIIYYSIETNHFVLIFASFFEYRKWKIRAKNLWIQNKVVETAP